MTVTLAGSGEAPPAAAPSRLARLASAAWPWPGIGVYVVARLPSFLEPRWYTDEAGYATTGRALAHGATIYSQAWTNKPPLHPLTIALPVLLGGGEASLHVLTFVSGLLTLAAVGLGGSRLLGQRRAALAVLLTAVVLGLPIVDAELAVPESLLIAPVTWAGVILVCRLGSTPERRGGRLWPLGVGALTAVAIAYQQTALAEACAFGLILLLSGRGALRRLGAYAAVVAGVTGLWLGAAIAAAGASTVGFALVGFYVPYSQAALPQDSGGLLRHGTILVLATALLVGGAVLLRHSASPRWCLWVWAGAAVLVPAAAQQPYAHFLIPGVAPAALALASTPRPRLAAGLGRRLGALCLGAGVSIAGVAARTAGLDWIPGWAPNGLSDTRTLTGYYVGALGVATGRRPLDAWRDGFDDRVGADRATVAWLADHGLTGRTAVVWSSDAWVYIGAALPLLLRTAPIYNDEVLLGVGGPVADRVRALDPDLLITADDAVGNFPEIGGLLGTRYRQAVRFGSEVVWLRGRSAPAAAPAL